MSRPIFSAEKALSALPENLLQDPLEYMKADHFRQETMRAMLGEAGARSLPPDALTAAMAYMEEELPRHLADEDDDLFPLLRGHAPERSPLHDVIAVLTDGHARLRSACERVIDEFRTSASRGHWPESDRLCNTIGAFCELNRWTVQLEERIVIPAARECLDRSTLAAVARAMSHRRDVPFPASLN